MNIAQQLATVHSRANANLIQEYILLHPEALPELMEVFFTAAPSLATRVAMVVGNLGRENPEWLTTYHERLITYASGAAHDAVRRNVTRYFSELPIGKINEQNEGPLVDLAFRFAADERAAIAIRVYGIQIIYNYTERYPELGEELAELIRHTIAEGTTPAFRNRGSKLLKKLDY